MYRRNAEAQERSRQRQERENNASRLHDEVPALKELRLDVSFRRGDTDVSESSHKKRVVVERAPALFVIPCANKECTDGGHDVTSDIMRALRAKMERFEGAHACGGTVANAPCSGVLRFTATAEYS